MTKILTEKAIERLHGTGKRQTVFDGACRGFYVSVTADGIKGYGVMARGPDGKQVWRVFKRVGEVTLKDARKMAGDAADLIRRGLEPFPRPTPPKTFGTEVEAFLKREVRDKLRRAGEVERLFNSYILPKWKDKALADIRRVDVANLLDEIQDGHGAVTADRCLAAVRRFFGWVQSRDDEFISPVVRGMARTSATEHARQRVLTDDEIRLLWGIPGQFADFCRLALLTGQRREKLATMRWDDIDDNGVWTIPTEAREKVNPGALDLPPMALEIIRRQPKIANCPYVFASRTRGPLAGFSTFKRDLDAALAKANDGKDLEPWVFHDLRRTARSLMARAGCRPDHAERALGHKIAGVQGVYDRYEYREEKKVALKALASTIDSILQPAAGNVVALAEAQR